MGAGDGSSGWASALFGASADGYLGVKEAEWE
jgi:hypothetical protein